MLRLTKTTTTAGVTALQLEGRLLGPWVSVVEQTVESLSPSTQVALDLHLLTFASDEGIDLLCRLRRSGVQFVACPQLIGLLCGD